MVMLMTHEERTTFYISIRLILTYYYASGEFLIQRHHTNYLPHTCYIIIIVKSVIRTNLIKNSLQNLSVN